MSGQAAGAQAAGAQAAGGPVLIGIDMGTTRVKALLVGLDGVERGQAERPTTWQHTRGGTQVDPVALAALGVEVAVEVAGLAERLGAQVLGVGVTGMGEAGVLVDRANRPLAPVIAWHDPRGDHARIEADLGRDGFQQGTGMHLDAQPSISKILWLQRNAAGCDQAVRFHSVPEWVVLALGGNPVSELSLASRTGLLGLADGKPWAAATELVGRPLLAELILAGEPAGVAGGNPAATGRPLPRSLAGATLTVAGHDHQTASLAVGAARSNTLLDSFGTAEALLRCVTAPIDPAAVGRLADRKVSVGWSVVPGHCTVLYGLLSGMTLERLAGLLGAGTREDRRALGTAALEAPRPDHAVLRELDGQTYVGPLAEGLSPAAVWNRAVHDLARTAADALEQIDAEVGPHGDVVLTGGWLRNPAVRAAKQAQYGGRAGWNEDVNEAGALGAAYLCGVAAGLVDRPPADGLPHWPLDPSKDDVHHDGKDAG